MEPLDWIRLTLLQARLRTPVLRAAEGFGGVEGFLAAPEGARAEALDALSGPRARWLAAILESQPTGVLESLAELGASVLVAEDPAYPPGLLDLPDAPPCLFALGDPSCLLRRTVAIVGSREAGIYGTDTAGALARGLAEAGICVVSGLAVGVDAAAHRGAIEGRGATCAVLGSGLDNPYPHANRELRERILTTGGCVVTELVPGTEPTPPEFPRRNRLIAALSLVTVVVGAREQSGALLTAGAALELGRDVAAVPGSVRDPWNRGAHQLIRDGAHVVDGPEAVLELIGGASALPSAPLDLAALSEDERRVFLALSHQPVHVDALGADLGLDSGRLAATLTVLLARGLAEPRPGGAWIRGV